MPVQQAKVYTITFTKGAELDLQTLAFSGVPGVPVSYQLAPTGGAAPYTIVAATLPAGLSMSPSGLITGTPAPGPAGVFQFDVTVTDTGV